MNTDPAVVHRLQEAGYNAEEGTFGIPYRGQEGSKIQTMWDNSYLPNHFRESDIVIIDLATDQTSPTPSGQKLVDKNGDFINVSAPLGIIDPRPFIMFRAKDSLDRILNHGGNIHNLC
jgi:hypothetical protein